MPKHVRFASTNVLYSLTSPPSTLSWAESFTKRRRRSSFSGVTPPPSFSSSSDPIPIPELSLPPRPRSRTSSTTSSSSSTSFSSPQNTPHTNPTSLPQTPLQLHFLLAYSPYTTSTTSSIIKYDLSLHPSTLASQYPPSSLLEPATNPLVSSLTIKSKNLPWVVFITPTTTNPLFTSLSLPPYVTVVDVLNSLYHDLRTPVHPSEYESVPEEVRREIDNAFWTRCRRVATANGEKGEEEETKKGVKRVDYLMGRNRFIGLSGTKKGSGVWELNVSK